MFAAMHPSGVAAPHSAHGQPSQLPKVVAIPVHGGLSFSTGADPQFVAVEGALCSGVGHSHSSSSLIHTSTSAARVMQRTSRACTALSAHSSSSIKSSLASLSMASFGSRVNLQSNL